MKIGFLLPSLLASKPYLTGRIFAPLYPAVNLTDALVDRGHKVYFFGSGDIKTKATVVPGDPSLTDKSLSYYQFRYRGREEQEYTNTEIAKRDFEYDLTLKAYKEALAGKLDIIHSYHDFGAHYFNDLTKFPTVYTLHDPLPQDTNTIEYHRLSKFKDHNYVSISNSQRRGIVALNFISTVYHGLILEDFEFDDQPEDRLIYFGRILEDKGPDIAIQLALASGIPLHMASGTVMANRSEGFYATKIAPFIDGKNVVLHEFLQGKERSDFIKKGKAFLFPLRWDEPFGLTMIESMACGTPVIAYNRGSVPEIVRDGLTGFIIEPEDSILDSKWTIKKKGVGGLIEAVKRIGEIDRRACRKHIEDNFTVEKMVEGYEKVYETVIGKK